MSTFLAIIPARGGSKGVPDKNKKLLCKKPLISWTIEAAKQSKYVTDVLVSSDDPDILEIAKTYEGVITLERPAHLATDTVSSSEVLLHVIENYPNYDYMIWLQPTSPLRTNLHIDEAVTQLTNQKADFCVSVTEAEPSPYLMYKVDKKNGNCIPLIPKPHPVRRQDYESYFLLNGAIYIGKTECFKQTKTFLTEDTIFYQMPRSLSYDIDTQDDFELCEFVMKKELCKSN